MLLPLLETLDINTAKLTALLSRLTQLFSHIQHDENQLLNGIWIGLLSVEALIVLGVMVRGLIGAAASRSRGGASEKGYYYYGRRSSAEMTRMSEAWEYEGGYGYGYWRE